MWMFESHRVNSHSDTHKIITVHQSSLRLWQTKIALDDVDVDNFWSTETCHKSSCILLLKWTDPLSLGTGFRNRVPVHHKHEPGVWEASFYVTWPIHVNPDPELVRGYNKSVTVMIDSKLISDSKVSEYTPIREIRFPSLGDVVKVLPLFLKFIYLQFVWTKCVSHALTNKNCRCQSTNTQGYPLSRVVGPLAHALSLFSSSVVLFKFKSAILF